MQDPTNTNNDFFEPKPVYHWFKGRYLTLWNGVRMPINEIDTPTLIAHCSHLKTQQRTKRTQQKLNYLDWIIKGRERDNTKMFKKFKYLPTVMELNEVTAYNLPNKVYEVSLLYKKAKIKKARALEKLLHSKLLELGYIYIEEHFDINKNWIPEQLKKI